MRSTKIIKICSSSLCTCLHHMVILRTRNKITDFLMILAWASPFKLFWLRLRNVGKKVNAPKTIMPTDGRMTGQTHTRRDKRPFQLRWKGDRKGEYYSIILAYICAPSKGETLAQRWFTVWPTSLTVGQ